MEQENLMNATLVNENINELLKNSTGIEFEKVIAKVFELIGFKSIWLEDQNDANPDVILEAWKCPSPYIVTIECFAQVSNSSEVPKEKVGQIRANGPKYSKDPKYIGKIDNLHLGVISRGKFSKHAIGASGNDVALITLDIVMDLLQDFYKGLIYSQEELKVIFQGSGERRDVFNEIRYQKYIKYMNLGLICFIVERSLEKKSLIDYRIIMGQVIAINKQNDIHISDIEIASNLDFLCHPVTGLIIRDRNNINHHELKNPDNFIKLGKTGENIQNWYKHWKKKLKPHKIDTSLFDST